MYRSIGKGCPLATAFKHKKYYKHNFKVVEPIEYILDDKDRSTLQHVPILTFLQQLFTDDHILNKALDSHLISGARGEEVTYKSFRDGLFFKDNQFLSGGELRVLLNLYVDDFEICNPLGTSCKEHNICGV